MQKQITLFIATFTVIALLLPNCSEQKFTFREKINVEKSQLVKTDSVKGKQTHFVFNELETKTAKDNVAVITSVEKSLPENFIINPKITKEILKTVIPKNKKGIVNDSQKSSKGNLNIPIDYGSPCPTSNPGLMLLGQVFLWTGLIMLLITLSAVSEVSSSGGSTSGAGCLIIGSLVLSVIGMAIFFGNKKPDAYISRTEEIPIEGAVNNTPLKVPTFSFNVPEQSKEKPSVSLALLHPTFAKDFYLIGTHPFTDFADRMEDDFKELLIARRYTFRGPFKEYDDILYSDKERTDLLVEIKINLKLVDNLETKLMIIPRYENQFWSCGKVIKVKKEDVNGYSYQESIGIGATISIVVSECLTREKLWTKNIEIDPERINVKSEKIYTDTKSTQYLWTNDAGFYNPLLGQLERFYDKTMQKAWNYLDPRELEALKPQVEKIRSESKFNRR